MHRRHPIRRNYASALLVVAALCMLSGCRKKVVQAAPSPPLPAEAKTQPDMPAPEVGGTPERTPLVLILPEARTEPPRPRPRPRATNPPTDPEPAATETASPKPEPPRIAPSYSPAEEATYRQQTNQSIAKAERNLQTMSGRRLNASQNDMVEKIRGFLGQAREAVQAGDWFRAQNLASKAEVLSDELVRSRG